MAMDRRLSERHIDRASGSKSVDRTMTAWRLPPASCISASARSTGRIRQPMSTNAWPPAKPAGASSALRCAAPTRAMRWRRRTGSTRLPFAAAQGEDLRVIGSIVSTLVAPENPEALLDALTDPGIRIVTLTVTEKAYLRDAAGDLDVAHPDIAWDLANPGRPKTLYGFLAEALVRRTAAATALFTVLCCDNLPANGATLATAPARSSPPNAAAGWRASRARSRSRRAWSTASCRRRPTGTGRVSPSGSASMTPGR